jgi:hemoglobin/transferrin/lactoferrin receptor protein
MNAAVETAAPRPRPWADGTRIPRRMPLCAILLISALSAAASLSGQARSETPPDTIRYRMPGVSVTANRHETDAFETNRPVAEASGDALWSRGFAAAADASALLPGTAAPSTGPWTGRWSIRGLTGGRVLLLVDGQRLDILRGYGEHPPLLDADQIVRLEVIRGPASVLYGSDAVAGVVNLITGFAPSPGTASGWSGRSGVQFHSGSAQWNGTAGVRYDGRKTALSLNAVRRAAENMNTPGGRLPNTAFRGGALGAEASVRPVRGLRLSLSGQSDRMDRVGVPVDPWAARARFTAYDRDRLSLLLELRRPDRTWKGLSVRVYGQKERRRFDALISGKPRGALFVEQTQTAERRVRAAGVTCQSDWAIGPHYIVAGAEGFGHRVRSSRLADLLLRNDAGAVVKDPPADAAPPLPRLTQAGWGAFLNAELAAGRAFALQAGFRADRSLCRAEGTPGTLVETRLTGSETDVSGNAGLLVRLGPAVRLTANLGRAFRAPDPQELYFRGPGQTGFVIGDPDLRSETSLNADLGVKWKTAPFEGEVAAFRNRVDRLIVLRTLSAARDTFAYGNVGRALLTGGEIRFLWNLSGRIALGADASIVRGRDEASDRPLPGIPPARATLSVAVNGGRSRWNAEADLRLSGDRKNAAPNEARTGGTGLLDLSCGTVLESGWTAGLPVRLSLAVRNALNRSFRDPLSGVTWWDGPGRDVVVGLRVEW